MLGVTPEALDAVDVVGGVARLHELVRPVVDAVVVLVAPVDQAVVGAEAVGADDRALVHFILYDLHQRLARDVRHHPRVDLAVALEQAEDDGLALGPAAALSLHAPGAEVALVHLDLARERGLALADLHDPEAEEAVVAVGGVAVQAAEIGAVDGRDVHAEQLQDLPEFSLRNV